MSKQTLTKMHRNFIGRVIAKYKNGRIIQEVEMARRSDPVIAFPANHEPCRRCGKEMVVAQGQVAYFHSACRKKVRKFKNQGKQ